LSKIATVGVNQPGTVAKADHPPQPKGTARHFRPFWFLGKFTQEIQKMAIGRMPRSDPPRGSTTVAKWLFLMATHNAPLACC